jgi:uncharacterized membrane protein
MKKYFFAGLATLIPLAVTVYIVVFVVHLLTRPFMGFVTQLLEQLPIRSFGLITSEQLVRTISEVLILITLILFILLLGMIGRWFLVHSLIRLGDKILHRIPLVNKVYRAAKEIIQTLFVSGKNSFRQVVMIQFPHPGCYCIALVTNDAPRACSVASRQEMISVFIPTTPNPMTGFLLMAPQAEMIHLNMTTEEAIQYVVSCGVVHPGGRC